MDSLTPILAPAMPVFAALLLAHVLADFLLQTNWMVRHKRNGFVLLLHIAVVFALSTLALGGVWQVALPVTVAHLLIDMIKTGLPRRISNTLTGFLVDQAAHLATIAAAALAWPGALAAGWLAPHVPSLVAPAIALSGLIVTVQAGGFAVGLLSARFAAHLPQAGLPEAGRIIGQLERTLIFLLIFIGQPAGIGFLIAAKSVLRFDTTVQQKAGEYVIIGTLASFTWALASGYATLALLEIAATKP